MRDMFDRIKAWAAALKRDGLVLWFAYRDPRTPWYAKALALLIVGYALSPIDLIPDFIPVIGFLDELILLPGAIWLAIRLLPCSVVLDARARALAWMEAHRPHPRLWLGGVAIVALWILLAWMAWRWLVPAQP
jgi:uncharacterized membrane protein YkvA (DUF1232 family)